MYQSFHSSSKKNGKLIELWHNETDWQMHRLTMRMIEQTIKIMSGRCIRWVVAGYRRSGRVFVDTFYWVQYGSDAGERIFFDWYEIPWNRCKIQRTHTCLRLRHVYPRLVRYSRSVVELAVLFSEPASCNCSRAWYFALHAILLTNK